MLKISGSTSKDPYKILNSSDSQEDDDQKMRNRTMNLPVQIDQSAILSLSDEGMERCYKKLGDESKTGWSEEEFLKEKENLGRNVFDVNYYNAIFQKVLAYNKGSNSIVDRANGLVKAYAEVYDEIVQGYKSGTREIYKFNVEDNSYHKLTLEEELKKLNDTYNNEVDDYIDWERTQCSDDEFIRETLKEEVQDSKWSNWKLLSGYNKDDIRKKKDEYLNKLGKNLHNAGIFFRDNYAVFKTNNNDLSELLKKIRIV